MRTLAIVTTAALTLAGCATATTPVEDSPPVRHLALARLAEEPAHDDALPVKPDADPVDPDDAEAIAASLIATGLADQGLQVVDLGVETLAWTPAAATVQVAATHRGGGAATHTSVYELDLARDPDTPWRLVAFRQAH
jgi:hypothetical protein